MKNKTKVIIYSVIAASFIVFVPLLVTSDKSGSALLDSFAQCLTNKSAVMYGADWCPHCQNEKRAFGDSFRLINYVECPDDPNLCLEKEIRGYPTWIFPDPSAGPEQSGKKLEGEQGLERLSRESGCSLPD
ncbi:MAG: hypothetical protein HY505_02955 [Candidatus Yanofskybacteria bacterium]|nr:hypothetical protein [Candidatus Yanofskybacteria bacterium]